MRKVIINTSIGILLTLSQPSESMSGLLLTPVENEKVISDNFMDHFELVYKNFSLYNKSIKPNTITKFVDVVKHYKLDSTEVLLKTCVYQICCESGAKQIGRDGSVLTSSGNAVGITQIVPSTAYQYLRNVIKEKELDEMYSLGVTSVNFVKRFPRFKLTPPQKKQQRIEIKAWLSNEVNNMVLWGYIMRHNLNRRGYTLNDALLAYNQGNGYLNTYIKNGNSPSNHVYVKKINDLVSKSN